MTAGVDRAWPVGYAGCRSGGLPTRARAAATPSPERERALSQALRHLDSADIIENKRACQEGLDPRRGQRRHRVAAGVAALVRRLVCRELARLDDRVSRH